MNVNDMLDLLLYDLFQTLLKWDATLNDEVAAIAADEGQQHKN
jgi:hypothetical protein